MRKQIIAVSVLAALTGCASMTRETRSEEFAFQAINALDVLQTERIAHSHGRWDERGGYAIAGQYPKPSSVALLGVGYAALHLGLTAEMSAGNVPQGIIRGWEVVTIAGVTFCVVHNRTLGITIHGRF